MGRKKAYTTTELKLDMSPFRGPLPFDVTYFGSVIATVISPKGKWYECEKCGENTQNRIEFRDKGKWAKIILCDKCGEQLL